MPLSDFTPSFNASPINQEIVLTPKFAVCWHVDHQGCRRIIDILEDYQDVLVLPPNTISPGWKGRHIGWVAHSDATIVRDDRFSDDPMPVV